MSYHLYSTEGYRKVCYKQISFEENKIKGSSWYPDRPVNWMSRNTHRYTEVSGASEIRTTFKLPMEYLR